MRQVFNETGLASHHPTSSIKALVESQNTYVNNGCVCMYMCTSLQNYMVMYTNVGVMIKAAIRSGLD